MNSTIVSHSKTIIILALAVLLILQRECGGNKKCPDITEHTSIVYKYDSIPKYIEVGKPYPVETFVPVTLPGRIDTVKVLYDYYTKKIYERHFNDSSLNATLIDTVIENKINGSSFSYRWLKPTAITTTTVTPVAKQRSKLFLGLQLHGNLENQGAILNAALLTKKDHEYLIGYDPFLQEYSLGILFKIKLHK